MITKIIVECILKKVYVLLVVFYHDKVMLCYILNNVNCVLSAFC